MDAPGYVLKLPPLFFLQSRERPIKMDEIYKAEWLNDVTLAHGGIYCVIKTNENNKVICTTNAFKDGWEKANTIANALNETV